MVNPLNIILPFLHGKRQSQEAHEARNISDKVNEFAAALRGLSTAPPDGIEEKIYDFSVRLSQATTLSTAEAVGYVAECIRENVDRGRFPDGVIEGTFDELTAKYLSRPLDVFDKRHEVPYNDGGNR